MCLAICDMLYVMCDMLYVAVYLAHHPQPLLHESEELLVLLCCTALLGGVEDSAVEDSAVLAMEE